MSCNNGNSSLRHDLSSLSEHFGFSALVRRDNVLLLFHSYSWQNSGSSVSPSTIGRRSMAHSQETLPVTFVAPTCRSFRENETRRAAHAATRMPAHLSRVIFIFHRYYREIYPGCARKLRQSQCTQSLRNTKTVAQTRHKTTNYCHSTTNRIPFTMMARAFSISLPFSSLAPDLLLVQLVSPEASPREQERERL